MKLNAFVYTLGTKKTAEYLKIVTVQNTLQPVLK